MKRIISILCFWLLFSLQAFSQQKDYFQQEVNTSISVTLNDKEHSLSGEIQIEYHNNAPDQLSFIYFHLWPNAYKDLKTAWAKQKLEDNSTRFYYAGDHHRGFIDKLNFSVDDETVNWDYDENNSDISIVRLNKPLKPGDKIVIKTPFYVKIPSSFSRLGHVGDSYQITQWFPKPAVYDNRGWHQMPYLDQGEFYSEFGSYDVRITLPENYTVGATGLLQNESELQRLEQMAKETATKSFEPFMGQPPFPESSTDLKTLRYVASNVHDFAWFADKRFHVLKSEVLLKSGRIVDTWTMFTDRQAKLWENSIEYTDRSLKWYSDKVGEYPWPQATVVQSALSAGSGMEYPMVTVIGQVDRGRRLDEVITHEIGHNWFYGILANNERDYAWMDEGLNTYYELAYMKKYYNYTASLSEYFPEKMSNFINAEKVELGYAAYQYQCRHGLDQAIGTKADELSQINYYISAYDKPAALLKYLATYVGEDVFNKAMQQYYNEWKFKHPYPEDFRKVLEKETGKDLSWLFDDLIETNKKIDYAIKGSSKDRLTIANVGDVAGPFSVSGTLYGEPVETIWFEGFEGTKEIEFPTKKFINIVVDAVKVLPESNRRNNYLKRKTSIKLGADYEDPSKKSLYFSPLIGGNSYDKLMIGLAFYNSTIPSKKFEYVFAPLFGTSSLDITGLADLNYNIYPKSGFARRISFGAGFRTFNYNENSAYTFEALEEEQYHLKYYRVSPRLQFEFRKKSARDKITRILEFRSDNLILESPLLSRDTVPHPMMPMEDTILTVYSGNVTSSRMVNKISYSYSNRDILNPFGYKISLEQFADNNKEPRDFSYIKMSMEGTYKYIYKRNKGVSFRLYGSGFLYNATKSSVDTLGSSFGAYPVSLVSHNESDYHFDNLYFGRREQSGIFAQQIYLDEGGFKTPLPSIKDGKSNKFVFALNVKADLPFTIPIPIKPYVDLGYFRETRRSALLNGSSFSDQMFVSGGLAIEFGDGIFGLYFPLFNSSNLNSLLKSRGDYLKRIGFTLNLDLVNPFKIAKNLGPG